jgi:hypothetical protein
VAVYGNTKKTQGQSLQAKAQAAKTNFEFAKELGATGYADPDKASATPSAGRSGQQPAVAQQGQQ